MAVHQVDLSEAQTVLPDLIDLALNGGEVLITKSDQPVAKLVAVEQQRPRPQFGSARGMVKMADDFDAPLEDFREYME